MSEPAEMVAEDARRKADQALMLAVALPVSVFALFMPLVRIVNEI